MQSTIKLQLIQTIKLPFLDCEPGPLHTILQDGESIYYSDEINHSLVALDASGEIRWHHTKQGKKSGEFYYPKGIDVGWIGEDGDRTRCIAVCDSWNMRIQFFGLDGRFLTQWNAAGDISFSDIVDIRFLHGSDKSGHDGSSWVVLDRGQHMLLGLDLSGRPIFKIGRAFPEKLESRWTTPRAISNPQARLINRFRECLPYDPLFMPLRIYGRTQAALYVWEPKSRRLKQVVSGNLLPVWTDLPAGAEWIGAGEDGWASFNAGAISIFDFENRIWRSEEHKGQPIASGRFAGELWLQDGQLIRHLKSDAILEEEKLPRHSEIPPGFLRLRAEMEYILREIDPNGSGTAKSIVQRLRALATRISSLLFSENASADDIKAVQVDLEQFRPKTIAELQMLSHILWLAALKALQTHSFPRTNSIQQHLGQAMERLVQYVNRSFIDLLSFRDEWMISMPQGNFPFDNEIGLEKQIQTLVDDIAAAAMTAMEKFTELSWFAESVEAAAKEPNQWEDSHLPAAASSTVSLVFAHPYSGCRKANRLLRELDRIYLGSPGVASPVRPAAITHFQNQHLLVTLEGANQIMHLDAEGKVVGPLNIEHEFRRPFGIAVDAVGRLWISEPQTNSVSIVDLANNKCAGPDELYNLGQKLKFPFGIQKAPDGSIFLSDMKNHRILIFTADGDVRLFGNGEGTEPGKFRHPASCCFAAAEDVVWVVDLRNHRLQKLDLNGGFLKQIGDPGFGRGGLIMPEFCAIFDDGVIIANQWACIKALKVFSPNSDELEVVHLDYVPRGMLIHENRLLVCSNLGDHIHVYERA
jgi:hypothetical protein